MSLIITDSQNYTNIANAIRSKNGTSNTYKPTQMSNAILDIQSGGGGGCTNYSYQKDINFYDYDGTLLYSYALSDLPLTALPAQPDHSTNDVPLTFQQWTHTLAQVNACTDKLDVGATFIPTDGKTHLIINIATEGRMTVPLYISQTVANGVSINWGDGSAVQTIAGTGSVNTTHTYAAIGRYDITLNSAIGCTMTIGSGNFCVFGSFDDSNKVYRNMLQEAYIGTGVTNICCFALSYCSSLTYVVIPDGVTIVDGCAFDSCYSLSSVVIPDGVTSIGDGAFGCCYSLASIVIPNGMTSIIDNLFFNCYSLSSVVIPDGVTSIGAYAFCSCYSLSSVVIPDGVTSIGAYAFQSCTALYSIIIPQEVTSIGNNAFHNCKTLSSIVIPQGLTSIAANMLRSCNTFASIVIPHGVTSIDSSAFYDCYCVATYDFSSCTVVPTLSATNAFGNIPADCIMKIPSALFSEWSTATNWSTYASYMVAV